MSTCEDDDAWIELAQPKDWNEGQNNFKVLREKMGRKNESSTHKKSPKKIMLDHQR